MRDYNGNIAFSTVLDSKSVIPVNHALLLPNVKSFGGKVCYSIFFRLFHFRSFSCLDLSPWSSSPVFHLMLCHFSTAFEVRKIDGWTAGSESHFFLPPRLPARLNIPFRPQRSFTFQNCDCDAEVESRRQFSRLFYWLCIIPAIVDCCWKFKTFPNIKCFSLIYYL